MESVGFLAAPLRHLSHLYPACRLLQAARQLPLELLDSQSRTPPVKAETVERAKLREMQHPAWLEILRGTTGFLQ